MPAHDIKQVTGPTKKKKNCNEWALFEPRHSSASAAMCNGGYYDGDRYPECPSKYDCKAATVKKEKGKRALPVMNPSRPFSTRTIGGTPNLPKFERASPFAWTSLPTKNGEQVEVDEDETPWHYPYGQFPMAVVPPPVMPAPGQYPLAMQTPYARPTPTHMGGITPTFLPVGKHDIFSRLGKNIAQGMIGATGWHIFDFARTVDLFG